MNQFVSYKSNVNKLFKDDRQRFCTCIVIGF